MSSISQLSEECQQWPRVNRCNRKRMEACAYWDDQQLASSVASGFSESAAAPVLRETVTIYVNGIKTEVYKDAIANALYEQLRRPLNCAFNSGA